MNLRVPMAFVFLTVRNVTVPQIVLVVMMKIIALSRNLQFNLNHLSLKVHFMPFINLSYFYTHPIHKNPLTKKCLRTILFFVFV